MEEVLAEIYHGGDFGLNDNWGDNHDRGLAKGHTQFCVDCGRAINGNACMVLVSYDEAIHPFAIRADITVEQAKEMFPDQGLQLVPLGKTCAAKKLKIRVAYQRNLDFENPNGLSKWIEAGSN
jgi:hypothetical protein